MCVAAQAAQAAHKEDKAVVTVVVVVEEEENVMGRQARPPARQGRWILLNLRDPREPRFVRQG